MATQAYGEPELQVLKDVHWKAVDGSGTNCTNVIGVREKSIAEYAREASKAACLLQPHEATSSLGPKRCGARGGDQPA